MKKVYLLLLVIVLPLSLKAQQDQPKPCSAEEFNQFDFWVGEWNLTWSDSLHGTNKITKDLNGCVITENFNGNPAIKFRGMSVSTYNPRLKKWQQTWVDDQGNYLDFEGEFKDNKMVLSRDAVDKDGKSLMQRMVFYNIEAGSLDWNWEKSNDNGKTWQLLWKIHYRRK